MHMMIDLETLGTRPDAAIIQIGAVLFEPVSGGKLRNVSHQGFNQHVLLQDAAGSVDHGTIAWWMQQQSVAKMGEAMETKALPLGDVLQNFISWPMESCELSWEAISGVWANPVDFDLPILRSAFALFGQDAPWDRRATRDARTLFQLVGGRPEIDMTGFTYHDAFDDAVVQAMAVQKAMGQVRSLMQ